MKNFILIAVCVLLTASAAFAGVQGVAGAKLDAPQLVKFSDNISLGIEAGKNIYNIEPNGGSAWVEDDRGYYGVAKITCNWTLLDFSKK